MSVTFTERYEFEKAKARARRYMLEKKKLRCCIQEIFGDYYWKEITDIDRAVELCVEKLPTNLKDDRQIEEFVNEQI